MITASGIFGALYEIEQIREELRLGRGRRKVGRYNMGRRRPKKPKY